MAGLKLRLFLGAMKFTVYFYISEFWEDIVCVLSSVDFLFVCLGYSLISGNTLMGIWLVIWTGVEMWSHSFFEVTRYLLFGLDDKEKVSLVTVFFFTEHCFH